MAKISKNAKKLLALTLAGVMTVGTAVPGTAMSSVQEVKAADEEASVVNDLKAAFDRCYGNPVDIIKGTSYLNSDNTTITKKDVTTALNNDATLDWAAKYAKDYTFNVDKVENVEDMTSANATATITINSKDGNFTDTFTSSFAVNIISATTVKEALGDISLEDIASISYSDGQAKVEAAVETYLNLILKENEAYLKYITPGDFSISATATQSYDTGNEKGWSVDVTITNEAGTDTDTATYEDLTFSVKADSEETTASKAMDVLKEKLTEVSVSDDVSLAPAVTAPEAINTAIKDKANDLIALAGIDGRNTIDIKNASMTATGKWSGTITITDAQKKTATYNFTNLTITHKNESAVIENLEIVGGKTELNIHKDDTSIKSVELSDAVPAIKVTYGDEKHTTKQYTLKDLEQANIITYDKTIFNASKVGTYTITFTTTNTSTPVSVSHTVAVVNEAEVDTKDTSLGFESGNKILSNLVGVSSSNEDVASVRIEKDADTGENEAVWVKAVGAGSTEITLTAKDGTAYTATYMFKADGTLANTPKYSTVSSVRYIWNDPDTVGFTADDFDIIQLPEDPTETDVVKIEKTDLGGNSVFQITPVSHGTAELTLIGGDNGALKATYTIKVDNTGMTVTPGKKNFKNVSFDSSTAAKVAATIFDISDIEKSKTVPVDEFGFTSDDKIIFHSEVGDAGFDSIPAENITSAVIEKKSSDYTLTIKYGSQVVYQSKLNAESQMVTGKIENSVQNLGLVAETGAISDDQIKNTAGSSFNENIFNAEVKDINGVSYIVVSTGEDIDKSKDYAGTITVTDEFGNKAVLDVKYKANVKPYLTVTVSKEFAGYKGALLTAKKQYEFTLGEKASFDGAYLTDAADDEKLVDIQPYMIDGFTTAEATLDSNGNLIAKPGSVVYGGIEKSDKKQINYVVRPAVETVSDTALGLPSGETVSSVARRGDVSITATHKDGKTQILATEVGKTATIVATTNKGNTVAIKVTVDDEGNISTDITSNFKTSFTTILNNVETLGFVADAVETSNEDVAIAKLSGDRITIHSVAPGTASIYAKSGDTMTTIEVTVDEFGTVIIDRIIKATDNGFVRGEAITEGEYAGLDNWYYYIDGEMVTNNWVEVNENGTNVWYHFDKDGKMSRGWIIDESGWKIYNLDSNGRMRKDMWINAAANDALGMPAGLYHLQSDGAVQMNGWAESVTAGIYWYCNAGTGLFEQGNPASWSNSKLW